MISVEKPTCALRWLSLPEVNIDGRKAQGSHFGRRLRRTGRRASVEARRCESHADRQEQFSSLSAVVVSGGHRFAFAGRNCRAAARSSEPEEKYAGAAGRSGGY